tara:strand:- start:657 stop:1244 length:588 start_codon:yes stop_codon:yes gene_type:complete
VIEDGVLSEEEDTDNSGTESESDVEGVLREEGDTVSSGTDNESDVEGVLSKANDRDGVKEGQEDTSLSDSSEDSGTDCESDAEDEVGDDDYLESEKEALSARGSRLPRRDRLKRAADFTGSFSHLPLPYKDYALGFKACDEFNSLYAAYGWIYKRQGSRCPNKLGKMRIGARWAGSSSLTMFILRLPCSIVSRCM